MGEQQNILSGLVQTGTVTAIDSAKRKARVKFKDTGIISGWLYVLQHYGADFYIEPDAKHTHEITDTFTGFRMLSDEEINYSILAKIGGAIAWIFAPLGWGNWQAVVASITGLVAKENIVGTLGILYGGGDGTVYQNLATAFNGITGYSFLVFNLLCAPCFAAIGAIKREMNSQKWTWFAIGYQCGFAYAIALMVNQFGALFTGNGNVLGVIVGVVLLAFIVYMLVKPYKEATKLTAKIK